MAETGASDASSPDADKDFEPSAELLVHDYDDEATLEEEENLSGDSGDNEELDDLQKESDMPLEAVLAMYGYASGSEALDEEVNEAGGARSTNGEERLNNHDLTPKDQVSGDVAGQDNGSESSTIVDELLDNVDSSATSRLLNGSFADEDASFDGEDEDYMPILDEEMWKKTIQVGDEFQADIPDFITEADGSDSNTNTLEERLLWDPSVLDENEVTKYLKELSSGQVEMMELPEGVQARDDEQALYTLLQSDFNVEEAVRRKKLQTTPPTDPLSLWSEDECQNFESGLRVYGKNFFAIHHNKVRTRSVGELVQFYYFWKRTERREAFCSRGRLERKRFATPGITDYADRFIDRQDSEGEDEFAKMPSMDCLCNPGDMNAPTPETIEQTTPIVDPKPVVPSSPTHTMSDTATPTVLPPLAVSAEKRPHSETTAPSGDDNSLSIEDEAKRLKVEPVQPAATPVGN